MSPKNIVSLLLMSAAYFLSMSCTKENERLLRIAPDAQVTLCTRATFPQNRSICLSGRYNAPAGSPGSCEYFKNIMFKYRQNGEWYEDVVWPAAGSLDIFGFSAENYDDVSSVRWGEICTERIDMHLPDNRSRQDDILFGRASGDFRSTSGILSMRFYHALSLLSFSLEDEDEYEAGSVRKTITIDEVSVEDIYCEADLTAYNQTDEIRYEWSGMTARHSVPVRDGHIMVIPQKQTGIIVKFTVDNGDDNKLQFEKVISLEESSRYWEPGFNYDYHIRIKQSGVLVRTCVEPWKSDDIFMYFK